MHVQTPPAIWPSEPPTISSQSDTRLTLTWPDHEPKSLNVTWLRDNCVCSECRIEQTHEHRYFLGLHEEAPRVRAAAVTGDILRIDWTDGHRSEWAPGDFARVSHVAARRSVAAEPWSDDFELQTFDHDEVLADHAARLSFLDAVLRDGMVVVTDTPTESGECIRFLEALGVPIRDTPFDRLHDVYFHADGYNVAHTDEPLPPHNDFASYTWPPSGQLIHMLVNEVEGGDWVNVDGFRVLAQLRASHPEAIDVLAQVPVGFREHSDSAESWTRQPLVRLDSAGEIVGIRFSNQLMQPIDPTDPTLEAFYDAYHRLARAVSDPANQIQFRGHAGSMQVVHGHRILHARRGFDGMSGSRHLQDTYFEFDDLRSLAARMNGTAR